MLLITHVTLCPGHRLPLILILTFNSELETQLGLLGQSNK